MNDLVGHDVKNLYIDLSHIDAADARLLTVYLNFVGATQDFAWQVCGPKFSPHAVVRLADLTNEARCIADISLAPVAVTIWLVDQSPTGSESCWQLQRPLHLDEFAALLRRCEEHFSGSDASSAPKRLLPTASSDVTWTTAPKPSVDKDPVGRSSGVSGEVGLAAHDPVSATAFDEAATYKLVRWPPRDLISGSITAVKLLSFLSHQALTLDRLVVLSGVDRSKCAEVLRHLDAHSLLKRDTVYTDGLHSLLPQAKLKATSEEDTADLSLIKRLRRHLGIFR